MRIWSNSSQVEEKNGSFASLLNGTRPENSCLIIQTIICGYRFCHCCCWSQIVFHSIHLFEVERVLGSSCLLVCCCCCLYRYLWLMVVFGSLQPNRLCRGCCNQRWSCRLPSPQPTEETFQPKAGHHAPSSWAGLRFKVTIYTLLRCNKLIQGG